ncbi:uncharacterized protein LOC144709587 [Wolffia australiana]
MCGADLCGNMHCTSHKFAQLSIARARAVPSGRPHDDAGDGGEEECAASGHSGHHPGSLSADLVSGARVGGSRVCQGGRCGLGGGGEGSTTDVVGLGAGLGSGGEVHGLEVVNEVGEVDAEGDGGVDRAGGGGRDEDAEEQDDTVVVDPGVDWVDALEVDGEVGGDGGDDEAEVHAELDGKEEAAVGKGEEGPVGPSLRSLTASRTGHLHKYRNGGVRPLIFSNTPPLLNLLQFFSVLQFFPRASISPPKCGENCAIWGASSGNSTKIDGGMRFQEEIQRLMRDNASSFTELLAMAPDQAMQLLHDQAAGDFSTFPDGESKILAGISSFDESPLQKPDSKNKESEKSKVSKKKRSKSSSENGDELPYVHVRARRGQATDSHSLAERARREKINARMKLLQELVPGCSKISGTALVLDEIINHVQSLQRQVEFLSMRLAATNPRMKFSALDGFLSAEQCSSWWVDHGRPQEQQQIGGDGTGWWRGEELVEEAVLTGRSRVSLVGSVNSGPVRCNQLKQEL